MHDLSGLCSLVFECTIINNQRPDCQLLSLRPLFHVSVLRSGLSRGPRPEVFNADALLNVSASVKRIFLFYLILNGQHDNIISYRVMSLFPQNMVTSELSYHKYRLLWPTASDNSSKHYPLHLGPTVWLFPNYVIYEIAVYCSLKSKKRSISWTVDWSIAFTVSLACSDSKWTHIETVISYMIWEQSNSCPSVTGIVFEMLLSNTLSPLHQANTFDCFTLVLRRHWSNYSLKQQFKTLFRSPPRDNCFPVPKLLMK